MLSTWDVQLYWLYHWENILSMCHIEYFGENTYNMLLWLLKCFSTYHLTPYFGAWQLAGLSSDGSCDTQMIKPKVPLKLLCALLSGWSVHVSFIYFKHDNWTHFALICKDIWLIRKQNKPVRSTINTIYYRFYHTSLRCNCSGCATRATTFWGDYTNPCSR